MKRTYSLYSTGGEIGARRSRFSRDTIMAPNMKVIAALSLLMCTHAAYALPVPPPLAFAFSAMQANNCGGKFPMCPSQNQTPAIYTQFVAQDLAARLERVGPTSLLPPAANHGLASSCRVKALKPDPSETEPRFRP